MMRLAYLLLLLNLTCLSAGCHAMESLSYDIEDGSAYLGDHIADGGESLANWMRDLNE